MPTVTVRQRLVNPGRRRRKRNPARKMTLKQKLFFGSPAQRAAAKKKLRNGGKKRKRVAKKVTRKRRNPATRKVARTVRRRKTVTRKRTRTARAVSNPKRRKRATTTVRRRKRRVANVGQIITFGLAGNPGKKRTKKRKVTNVATRRRRRRANPGGRKRRYSHRRRNAGLMKMLGMSRRRRRSNPGRRRRNYGVRGRRRGYRRNPGMLSGAGVQVGGVIGGAAVTKLIFDKLIPAQYAAGITGYAVNLGVAFIQGYLVSRFLGKPALGAAMQLGGYTMVALRILNDYAPGLSSYSALGLRGALAQSSFYTPQVPQPNSFTSFVTPNAVRAAIPPPAMKGIRGGRTN